MAHPITDAAVMSVLLHLGEGEESGAEIVRYVSQLISTLTQHDVRLGVVVECPSALHTSLFQALQPQCSQVEVPILTVQPSQLDFALRSVLSQLGSPAERVLAVSLSAEPAPAAHTAASALRCATLHVPLEERSLLRLLVAQHFATLMARVTGCLVVGHVMKSSRALSLTVQGMLPLVPQGGVCFMPLEPGRSLTAQQPFDLLLQKPTDYLEEQPGSGRVPGFTTQLLELHAQLAAQPAVCVVDPLNWVHGVMDREALARLLDGVCSAACAAGVPMRAPSWVMLPGEPGQELQQAVAERLLAGAGVHLPAIVKPQVACGVSESHQMAFVLHPSGLQGLGVPLPAVAQEYVDHGGLVWKVYVAGDKVFMLQRKSTPDLQPLVQRHLAANPDADLPSSINFDSLKSLPTALPWARQLGEQQPAAAAAGSAQQGSGNRQLEQATAELVARLLREQLHLTLFGFDIVVDHQGKLVIIDVNFFPSFKGIPEAPQALREALLARHKEYLASLPSAC